MITRLAWSLKRRDPMGLRSILPWSWRRESNPQPTDYKSVALPLSYASRGIATIAQPDREFHVPGLTFHVACLSTWALAFTRSDILKVNPKPESRVYSQSGTWNRKSPSIVILEGQLVSGNPVAPKFTQELKMADSPRAEYQAALFPHLWNSKKAIRNRPCQRPRDLPACGFLDETTGRSPAQHSCSQVPEPSIDREDRTQQQER